MAAVALSVVIIVQEGVNYENVRYLSILLAIAQDALIEKPRRLTSLVPLATMRHNNHQ